MRHTKNTLLKLYSFSFLLFGLLLISCSKDDEGDSDSQVVETVTDIDGNKYGIVEIGSQRWFNSNLRVTKYNDGTPIIELSSNQAWDDAIDEWTPARCIYNNDSSLKETHGLIYNFWSVSEIYNGGRNICPSGYRIPTIADWEELRIFLDADGTGANNTAGGPLKATGTTYWKSPNTDASNATGFSAIPCGDRSASSGSFDDFDRKANFWSSTSEEPISGGGRAYFVNLTFGNGELLFSAPKSKGMGFSCRCIKE